MVNLFRGKSETHSHRPFETAQDEVVILDANASQIIDVNYENLPHRGVDAFAHTVAHDLKNIVNVIISYARLLTHDDAALSDDERQRALRAIEKSGYRISTIVDELLFLAEPRKSEVATAPLELFKSGDFALVLSAHEDLKVRALDSGADDYVTKPFPREELLARVPAKTGSSDKMAKIRINGLTIDLQARRAFVDGADIHLTRTEFALLAELAQNQETVMTHKNLLGRVWGPEYRDSSHYLHVYLGRIRRKLGAKLEALLETVPGVGYMMHSAQPDLTLNYNDWIPAHVMASVASLRHSLRSPGTLRFSLF